MRYKYTVPIMRSRCRNSGDLTTSKNMKILLDKRPRLHANTSHNIFQLYTIAYFNQTGEYTACKGNKFGDNNTLWN